MPTREMLRRLVPAAAVVVMFVALVLVAVRSAPGGAAGAAAPAATVRTVTSSATGTATGVPDQLTATMGVHTTGPTATGVLHDSNTRTQAIIDALKGAGISADDIQTVQVNLGPNNDEGGHLNGYAADNQLSVTMRDLSKAGAQLDSITAAAGDSARISSVQLGFNHDDALKSSARADAVKRARAQAEEMAKAAGADVGNVRTITDVTSSTPVYGPEAASDAAGASAVPIAPGTQELSIQVRVVFDLR